MSKWYAVKAGRVPGIYSSWPTCSQQTNGYPGSVFKSFPSRDEALNYLYDGKIPETEKRTGPFLGSPLLVSVSEPKVSHGRTHGEGKSENSWDILFSEGIVVDPDDDVDPNGGIELPSKRASPKIPVLTLATDPQDHEETEPFYYGSFTPPRVEGKRFLQADRSLLDTHSSLLVIYIDGSKRPTVNHRGSGAYCRFGGRDYSLAVPFTPEIAIKYQILQSDVPALSSPTMEYLALGEVLWRFIQIRLPEVNGVVQLINPRLKLIFVGDYLGVKCFTEGSWSAKEDYIKKIQFLSQTVIKFLKERGIDVEIQHCNGHVGILGNELSDVLAKSQVACDEFQTLVNDLSTSFQNRL